MRGQDQLIAMRKAGKRPAIVFINDYPCQTDWADWGDHATVCVDGDQLSSLDLRFVVGMTVSVSSLSEARAKRIAEICKQAGARTVAGAHGIRIDDYQTTTGWADVWQAEQKKECESA